MAVRRRSRPVKAAPAPTNRVHPVNDLDQWHSLLAKTEAGGRLLVVQFYQASNYVCARMRGLFKQMSVDPGFKAAVFAEVELDTAEDVVNECGLREGTVKIPAYHCYLGGELVETYAGGVPGEVAAMLQRQLAQLRGGGSGLLKRLLLAAGVLAAGAAAAWWHFGRGGSGSRGGIGGDALGSELRSVAERIGIARQRLRNAERAGKAKAARNQRRILQQLEAQQRLLEQRLHQRQQPAGSSSGGGGKKKAPKAAAAANPGAARSAAAYSDDEDAEQAAAPRQQRQRRRQAAAADYSSDEEAGGAAVVAYSDEEEE